MRLYAYEQIDSTNLEAKRLWEQRGAMGDVAPFAVRARHQTAGMGRNGRAWLSPRNGLWMSVVWPMRQDPTRYEAAPLVAGLACAQAIEGQTALQCQIKWPNDVLVGGRKLAGILCQAEIGGAGAAGGASGAIIAGIGINGNYTIESLGDGLRQAPTTLQHELGHDVDLPKLCEEVCRKAQELLEEFERGGLGSVLEGVRRRLAWRGQEVRLMDLEGAVRAAGRLLGLDERGYVLIERNGATETLAIGEMYLAFQMAQAAMV